MQQLLRVARRAVRAAASLRGGHGTVTVLVHASGAPRCAGMASSSAGAAGAASSSGSRAPPLGAHGRLMQPHHRPARVVSPLVAVVDVPLRPARGGGAVAAAAATSNRGGSAGPRSSVSRPARPLARQQPEAEEDAGPSFQDLGMGPPLMAALEAMGIAKPTEIQAMALPALAQQPGNYFLASHTGSGKTLSYLLPLVQLMKAEEAAGFVPRPKRPRVLVLGPTKELTEQITRVAKGLCHHAKFRATCANAYESVAQQAKQLAGPMDVLVATPTRLLQHIREGNVAYRDVRWLVIDEADTVFSQGWGPEVAQILKPLREKPDPAHVLMVSATLTKPIQRAISELVPDTRELKTSSLHKAVGGSRHQFMAMPPGANKMQMLAEVLSADNRRAQKVLVFCNTVDSVRAVEHFCQEERLPCVCYHGEMPMETRQAAMATFSGASVEEGGQPIMIASDLAARGLDFPGQVDHVINFDFPGSSVDYLHRTGRTARAGNSGKITSIVSKRDKVLAQRIQWALEHDEALDGLSADKGKLPPGQAGAKRREATNNKSREATAVLGEKGMARLRSRTAAAAGTPRLRLRGAGAGAAEGEGKKGDRKAAVALRGPVRGAARQALLQERLERRNKEAGKAVWRAPPSKGAGGGSSGSAKGGAKGSSKR